MIPGKEKPTDNNNKEVRESGESIEQRLTVKQWGRNFSPLVLAHMPGYDLSSLFLYWEAWAPSMKCVQTLAQHWDSGPRQSLDITAGASHAEASQLQGKTHKAPKDIHQMCCGSCVVQKAQQQQGEAAENKFSNTESFKGQRKYHPRHLTLLFLKWQGSHPGPHAYRTWALPLSHIIRPYRIFQYMMSYLSLKLKWWKNCTYSST